jgi:hypothetical protein
MKAVVKFTAAEFTQVLSQQPSFLQSVSSKSISRFVIQDKNFIVANNLLLEVPNGILPCNTV